RACATSAMRSSSNASQLVEMCKKHADIDIEVIDGSREAEIIYANGIAEMLDHDRPYIYVDVGGGSTEITVFEKGEIKASKSFNIGTIRILKGMIGKPDFDQVRDWIKSIVPKMEQPKIIGSGGNINKLYKLARKPVGESLSQKEVKNLFEFLNGFSVNDRIKLLSLNPDRADVIVPATKIFLKIMKWSGAKEVIVPTIGISDGIIRTLYNDYKQQPVIQQ
ncbi:MAG TPA: ethanolamine ammonia-lyase reactivating factor EutA, partial [Bacteroidales bacterium]|nr:ethanolamine ammonia-lyase reactivating factor EutA [Bacteroidales bacterium]